MSETTNYLRGDWEYEKYQHPACNCHECTQARWKMSLQCQMEGALRSRVPVETDAPKDGKAKEPKPAAATKGKT